MRVPMLLMCTALVLAAPVQGAPLRTWQDIRFAVVTRQVEDYSCGAASIVTLLRASFGDERGEQALLKAYLERQTPAKAEDIVTNGLTLLDLGAMVQALGYRSAGVKIALLDLVGTHRPAIVFVERDGLRHFVVFEGLEGQDVVLLDPTFGRRRVSIEAFLAMWRGHALFVMRVGDEAAVQGVITASRPPVSDLVRSLLRAPARVAR